MNGIYADRSAAGRDLAKYFAHLSGQPDLIVLALPRGGVPVGFEVSKALKCPLDVLTVRKIGFPGNPELALGAIASGGARKINERLTPYVPDAAAFIEMQATVESYELERREREYRQGRPAPNLANKTVILVDDGLATGSTMYVATMAARQLAAGKIIVAVPVGTVEAVEHLKLQADEVVCLHTPNDFQAVGQYYADFNQTTDQQVTLLLAAAENLVASGSPSV